jgi:hypothetical protein
MAHTEIQIPHSPEEENFYEFLRNGDDFSKIEIFGLAKFWYQKALETGFEPELMKKRIDELNEKIRVERKVITILAVIAAFIILGAVLLTGFNHLLRATAGFRYSTGNFSNMFGIATSFYFRCLQVNSMVSILT